MYCLKCKKYTENKNWKVLPTSKDIAMLYAHFVLCISKYIYIYIYIKEQEGRFLDFLDTLNTTTQII